MPLFLLIQTFHCYKNGVDKVKAIRWKNVLIKLAIPFIIAEFTIVALKSLYDGLPLSTCISLCLKNWGFGPGEYYIWEYFQFLLLLPIVAFLFRQIPKTFSGWISVVICILLEFLAGWLQISEHTYKFLFFRYFFLIYLGYRWAIDNVVLNRKSLLLSCLRIAFIIVFDYTNIDLSPLFFNSSWKCFHWICYFYPAYLLVFLIHGMHNRLSSKIKKIIEDMGRNSWMIFCIQLVVFSFLSPDSFQFVNPVTLRGIMYLMTSVIVSIAPVLIVNKLRLRSSLNLRGA